MKQNLGSKIMKLVIHFESGPWKLQGFASTTVKENAYPNIEHFWVNRFDGLEPIKLVMVGFKPKISSIQDPKQKFVSEVLTKSVSMIWVKFWIKWSLYLSL